MYFTREQLKHHYFLTLVIDCECNFPKVYGRIQATPDSAWRHLTVKGLRRKYRSILRHRGVFQGMPKSVATDKLQRDKWFRERWDGFIEAYRLRHLDLV